MKTINALTSIFLLLFLASCISGLKESTSSEHGQIEVETNNPPIISSITMTGNQKFTITGDYLADSRDAKLVQTGNTYDLPIVSKTKTQLIVQASANILITADVLAKIVVSTAFGQTSSTINFTISDGSISTAKIADGAITSEKIDDMGAANGEVLTFDNGAWKPGAISGFDYKGSYIPSFNSPPSLTPAHGDLYISTTTVSGVDIDGGGNTPSRNYSGGDWLIYNSDSLSWDHYTNTAAGNFLSKSGNNLYYTLGSLSVGVNTPTSIITAGENSLLGTYNGEMISVTGTTIVNGSWARSMSFGLNGSKHVKLGAYGTTLGGTSNLDYFFIDTSSSSTPWSAAKFIITSAGYVGINNYSPSEELDVTGTVKATSFVGDGSGLTGIVATDGLTNITDTTVTADNDTNGTGSILFKIGATSVGAFNNAGNFGVGTVNPADKLSVVGDARISNDVFVMNDLSVSGDAAITGNVTTTGRHSSTNISVDTNLIYTDSATNRVGINTSSPQRSLDIQGDVLIRDCIVSSDNSTQILGTCTSDKRFKKDFEKIDGLSHKFSYLNIYNYNWRVSEFPEFNFSENRSTGVIAQEVEDVFPELVVEDQSGLKKVNYSKLQLYTIGAVSEQQREIESLKSENKALKSFLCEKFPEADFCAR